jgi:hypothetical protein
MEGIGRSSGSASSSSDSIWSSATSCSVDGMASSGEIALGDGSVGLRHLDGGKFAFPWVG